MDTHLEFEDWTRWQIVDIPKPKKWLTTLKKEDWYPQGPITSKNQSPLQIHKKEKQLSPHEEWLPAQHFQSPTPEISVTLLLCTQW
jgi:hypothetical protein